MEIVIDSSVLVGILAPRDMWHRLYEKDRAGEVETLLNRAVFQLLPVLMLILTNCRGCGGWWRHLTWLLHIPEPDLSFIRPNWIV